MTKKIFNDETRAGIILNYLGTKYLFVSHYHSNTIDKIVAWIKERDGGEDWEIRENLKKNRNIEFGKYSQEEGFKAYGKARQEKSFRDYF